MWGGSFQNSAKFKLPNIKTTNYIITHNVCVCVCERERQHSPDVG